jgi:tetratricopeptide (TPR) repeat protein
LKKALGLFLLFFFNSLSWGVDEGEYYLEKANGYFSRGNMEEASGYFENAVNSDPEIFSLLSGNGTLEKILKDPSPIISANVEQMCILLLEKKYKDNFIYFYLGWAECNLFKKKEAILHLRKTALLLRKEGIHLSLVRELLRKAENLTCEKKPNSDRT